MIERSSHSSILRILQLNCFGLNEMLAGIGQG